MATAGKGNMTPGRQRKTTQAQYFDVGKVGRYARIAWKTGLVLKDTGIRDEHGMEPVSGIFSSPIASPQRNGDATLSSDEMHMQESSAPEVTEALILRKTPKLPPARAATPKHTNIGSPKRMSSARPISRGKSLPLENNGIEESPSNTLAKTQPPANRILDFAPDVVRKSIESISPFIPRKVLRRSVGPARPDPFALRAESVPDAKPVQMQTTTLSEEDETQHKEQDEGEAEDVPAPQPVTISEEPEAQEEVEEDATPQPADDGPLLVDDDDAYQVIPDETVPEVDEAHVAEQQETPVKRKRGRPRKSGDSANSTQIQQTPQSGSTTQKRKRGRPSLQSLRAEAEISDSQLSESGEAALPAQKRPRGRPVKNEVIVLDDEDDQTIDPTLLTNDNENVNENVEEDDPESSTHAQQKNKRRHPAPKERDANRAMRAASSPVKLNDGPSRLSKSPGKRAPSRGASMGPVSNVNLRATTPFEDAGERISRYGRPVLKPLQYWANETRVWKNGEVEGIIRAEEVQKPKPAKKRGRKPAKKAGVTRLDDIDEESETESTLADEWEEEVGVIAGSVANWDSAAQMGDPRNLVREDLAFAASSIVTRDVANSEFKYAKIMTLPFFGSGVVELPPEGFKRAKNSRKMQMCFFVHEGKVMVEVGAQGANGEVNQFAISKGGVWVVPRGNNYAITNESRTKTARIFFAQGCEVDPSASAAAARGTSE